MADFVYFLGPPDLGDGRRTLHTALTGEAGTLCAMPTVTIEPVPDPDKVEPVPWPCPVCTGRRLAIVAAEPASAASAPEEQ